MTSVKVLILFPSFAVGGGPVAFLNSIKCAPKNYEFAIAGSDSPKGLGEEFIQAGSLVRYIPLNKISFIALVRLIKLVKLFHPSIIHTSGKGGSFYGLLLYLFFFFKKTEIKFFHTFHGFKAPSNTLGRALYFLLELCYSKVYKKGVCVSQSEVDRIQKFGVFKSSTLTIINNPVIVQKLSLIPKANSCLVNSNYPSKFRSIRFVCFGRPHVQKNLAELFLAFSLLQADGHSFYLDVYGHFDNFIDSFPDSRLQKLFDEHIVTYRGISFDSLRTLSQYDVFISSSLWEGAPMSVIECFSVGLPCLLSPNSAHIEQAHLSGPSAGILSGFDSLKIAEGILAFIYDQSRDEHFLRIQNALKTAQRHTCANYWHTLDLLYSM